MKLNIGDKMPDFTFNTESQTGVTTKDVLAGGRTIFWVLRYIGCTMCRFDVHQISTRYSEFTEKGAQVYVVMQSDPAVVREDLKDSPAPFHIICDEEQVFYKALEIYPAESKEARAPKTPEDIAKLEVKRAQVKASGFVHGKYEGNEQQLPAMFIVEPDGTVVYSHYARNIVDMPTIDEVLTILDELGTVE